MGKNSDTMKLGVGMMVESKSKTRRTEPFIEHRFERKSETGLNLADKGKIYAITCQGATSCDAQETKPA